jgi:hypothetical protein
MSSSIDDDYQVIGEVLSALSQFVSAKVDIPDTPNCSGTFVASHIWVDRSMAP